MRRTQVRRRRASLLAIGVVAGCAFLGGRASANQAHAAPGLVVVVRQGDTVWSIARQAVGPTADPRPMVQLVVERNHLRDGVIMVGERLTVPTP